MEGFTPGPWIAKKGAGWYVARLNARKREAALAVGMFPETSIVTAPRWPENDKECEMNARLMAKAPDMHAALEGVIEALDGYVDVAEPDSEGHPRPNWAMALTTTCKRAIGDLEDY